MVVISEARATGSGQRHGTATSGAAGIAIATPQRQAGFSHVLACVNGSPHAAEVLGWAAVLARRFDASLHVLRVLDMSVGTATPVDPATCELHRQKARSRLEGLLADAGVSDADGTVIEVAVGPFHQRFQDFLATTAVDLCVIGAVDETTQAGRILGDTARRIVETAPCSVLIVPPRTADEPGRGAVEPRRLMVPLDCSRRAEAALPAATALADAFGAEILMAHAVPEPAITEIGPPDATDVALRRDVAERNRKAAERYMSRLRARLALDRRPIRTLILSGADPRHRLARAAVDEAVDLIVLAAKGAGGYADQALGSVADFLVTHLAKPLLIVRPDADRRAAARTGPDIATGAEKPIRSWA